MCESCQRAMNASRESRAGCGNTLIITAPGLRAPSGQSRLAKSRGTDSVTRYPATRAHTPRSAASQSARVSTLASQDEAVPANGSRSSRTGTEAPRSCAPSATCITTCRATDRTSAGPADSRRRLAKTPASSRVARQSR